MRVYVKGYYAIFDAPLVKDINYHVDGRFVDIECSFKAADMEDAYEYALDALARYAANVYPVLPKPSTFEEVKVTATSLSNIMFIPLSWKLINKYTTTVRWNLSLPTALAEKLEETAKDLGLDRSSFLAKLMEEYDTSKINR